jgi:methyl-accepting chemotaxis protein
MFKEVIKMIKLTDTRKTPTAFKNRCYDKVQRVRKLMRNVKRTSQQQAKQVIAAAAAASEMTNRVSLLFPHCEILVKLD